MPHRPIEPVSEDTLGVGRVLEGAGGGTQDFIPLHAEALVDRAVLGSVPTKYAKQLYFRTRAPLESNVLEDTQITRVSCTNPFAPAIPPHLLCGKLWPYWPVDREDARAR